MNQYYVGQPILYNSLIESSAFVLASLEAVNAGADLDWKPRIFLQALGATVLAFIHGGRRFDAFRLKRKPVEQPPHHPVTHTELLRSCVGVPTHFCWWVF